MQNLKKRNCFIVLPVAIGNGNSFPKWSEHRQSRLEFELCSPVPFSTVKTLPLPQTTAPSPVSKIYAERLQQVWFIWKMTPTYYTGSPGVQVNCLQTLQMSSCFFSHLQQRKHMSADTIFKDWTRRRKKKLKLKFDFLFTRTSLNLAWNRFHNHKQNKFDDQKLKHTQWRV